MPKILIVVATKFEVLPLLNHFKMNVDAAKGLFISTSGTDVNVLITGVGMVNTAYYLGGSKPNKFDYVINIGVCGAFNRELKIGEIVNIIEDTISELGAEDDKEFIKYAALNLGGTNSYRAQFSNNVALLLAIKKVKGITVNKIHGNEESIKAATTLFTPDVESMEGAAFLRSCTHLSENYFQLRAISNFVEKRDKSKWNMPLAINNLNDFVVKLITNLNV